MRIIAFVNKGSVIREISGHLGEPTSTPSPALPWELPVAGQVEQDVDPRARQALDYEVDRVSTGKGGTDLAFRLSRSGLGCRGRVLRGRVRFLNAVPV